MSKNTGSFPIHPIDKVVDRLKTTQKLNIRGLSQNAHSWCGALLAHKLSLKDSGPVLWVVADERRAEQLVAEIGFYLGQEPDELAHGDPFSSPLAHFPLHQLSPYEDLSPDRDALCDRLALLFRLMHASAPSIIITSVPALLRKVIPKSALDSASRLVLVGQQVDQRKLAAGLVRAGYLNVPVVEEPGGFLIRGGIMDIFAPQYAFPIRIEWFGDDVESIRMFDPQNQRTLTKMDQAFIGPVREILQDQSDIKRVLANIDKRAHDLDLASHKLLKHRRKLTEGIRYFGIEALLPAFYPTLWTLFDYLPAHIQVVLDDPGGILSAAKYAQDKVNLAYQESRKAGELVFESAQLLIKPVELFALFDKHRRIDIGLSDLFENAEPESSPTQNAPNKTHNLVQMGCTDLENLRDRIQQAQADQDPLQPFVDKLKEWHRYGYSVFISSSRAGRARQIRQWINARGLAVRLEEDPFFLDWLNQHTPNLFLRVVKGELSGGFCCPDARLVIFSDSLIFGRSARKSRPTKGSREVLKLQPGQLIVHVDFGIGRFEGLVKLQAGGFEADYLLLHYKDQDKLYLPVTRMNLIERYSGPQEKHPPLSKLGGSTWERTKQKIHQALLEMADELVRTEALRRARPGTSINQPEQDYELLASSFPFEETADQKSAINEVIHDQTQPQAMDRLICGDVGFGKTEVAVRAAYLACLAGQQTMLMVPTTLLALQHLTTFRTRLENLSVRVEMLSRMTPKAAQKPITEDFRAGQIDILIGTHRLLADDIKPRSLGLLIIDEEHRFGVKHKESIKQLRTSVDVLTMTATPLPRTLQLALTGLRNISVIRTPPPGRRSIRTLIARFSKSVIIEAIERERQRGGQVFFVHNFVRSLPAMKRFLSRLVPQASIEIAHGQLHERALEKVMGTFVGREIDVLLCSSIIESGLDIPSANTIIVNRADRFGLAQLYQIRGRVGRSAERAYAYFLIPGLDAITDDARRRLEALSENSQLGAGYQIASRDLEIRGAGNLLGKAQSGHIKAIGFDLYNRLLERALMEVRGQLTSTTLEPEIQLPVPGFLPRRLCRADAGAPRFSMLDLREPKTRSRCLI